MGLCDAWCIVPGGSCVAHGGRDRRHLRCHGLLKSAEDTRSESVCGNCNRRVLFSGKPRPLFVEACKVSFESVRVVDQKNFHPGRIGVWFDIQPLNDEASAAEGHLFSNEERIPSYKATRFRRRHPDHRHVVLLSAGRFWVAGKHPNVCRTSPVGTMTKR